jgi:hypothetical protein
MQPRRKIYVDFLTFCLLSVHMITVYWSSLIFKGKSFYLRIKNSSKSVFIHLRDLTVFRPRGKKIINIFGNCFETAYNLCGKIADGNLTLVVEYLGSWELFKYANTIVSCRVSRAVFQFFFPWWETCAIS